MSYRNGSAEFPLIPNACRDIPEIISIHVMNKTIRGMIFKTAVYDGEILMEILQHGRNFMMDLLNEHRPVQIRDSHIHFRERMDHEADFLEMVMKSLKDLIHVCLPLHDSK